MCSCMLPGILPNWPPTKLGFDPGAHFPFFYLQFQVEILKPLHMAHDVGGEAALSNKVALPNQVIMPN